MFSRKVTCGGISFGKECAAVTDHFKLIAQLPPRQEAVHLPRAVHLALDGHAGWKVLEENAVRRLVDLLPTGPRAAHEFFEQTFFGDAEGGHPLFESGLLFG